MAAEDSPTTVDTAPPQQPAPGGEGEPRSRVAKKLAERRQLGGRGVPGPGGDAAADDAEQPLMNPSGNPVQQPSQRPVQAFYSEKLEGRKPETAGDRPETAKPDGDERPPRRPRGDRKRQEPERERERVEAPVQVSGRALTRMLDAELDDELDEMLGQFDADKLMGGDDKEAGDKAERAAATLEQGAAVKGKVLSVRGGDVFVDLGLAAEGVLPTLQYEESGDPLPEVGAELDLVVDRFDGREQLYALRRPGVVQEADWGSVQPGMIVNAMVRKANKGGLEVTVNGIRGFMPAGQADIYHLEDLTTLVGKSLKCEILETDADRKNLVVSHKAVLVQEREEKARVLRETLTEGEVYEGTVRKLMDFGAFVDLGGVDGLIHISQMAWTRIEHPSEVVSEGQAVRVKLLNYDKENDRIGLGLKQLQESPWERAAKTLSPGDVVEGKVTKLMDFGAFVEVNEIEGLVHISELAWRHVVRPDTVVKKGDVVQVKVLEVDPGRQRASLSIKQTTVDPAEEKRAQQAAKAAEGEAAEDAAPEKPRQPVGPLKGGLGSGDGPLFKMG